MNAKVPNARIVELRSKLQEISESYESVVFSTSLSAEDMLLTDVIARFVPSISIITLDTGRLHEETYQLLAKTQERYRIALSVIYPDAEDLTKYVKHQGINGFYDSVESRKACCRIRKTDPLKRALANADAWITGLRSGQSVTRTETPVSSWDDYFRVQKYNPLIEWTEQEVWQYIEANQVPVNELHKRGFPSIGCAPCTRAITQGEDIRAGRWWWETPETKECGLHNNNAGQRIEVNVLPSAETGATN